ncbi:hypothetical protein [Variovorax sp. JS1663]|uniref:hypothetical protein n=1 Tax=Variovorax sp. JS1663 TaxID=1851577 RepID=UPI00117D2B61|nr:hypothetical protein [Variovorax sp. JS1663]
MQRLISLGSALLLRTACSTHVSCAISIELHTLFLGSLQPGGALLFNQVAVRPVGSQSSSDSDPSLIRNSENPAGAATLRLTVNSIS